VKNFKYLRTTLTNHENTKRIVVFLFNTVIYVFLLLGLCILIVQLPWLRVLRAFSSVVRQMPGYNSPRRSTARTVPITLLSCSMYCLFFLSFCVLFVCKCVMYYCHRVSTQLQLTNISIYQHQTETFSTERFVFLQTNIQIKIQHTEL
jgi:hypothetical protein